MVYKKEVPLALKGSASALCNNLSILLNLSKGLISYAVVHKSVVNLISSTTDGSSANHRQVICKEPSATHPSTLVIQARLVAMATRTILVITSQKGIQMFEADGSLMLYWYALGEVAQEELSLCFGRGICGTDKNTICVGTYEGNILIFDVPDKSPNITLSETLKGHQGPICDLESDSHQMISSDDMGNIILWSTGDTFRQIIKISGEGDPCSSIGLWNDLIIGGYGSGHLRVYSATTGKMCVEASAHAKWITAIDVAKSTGLILSASEDTFARVWKLSSGSNVKMELVHSETIADLQLQGAKFISEDGRAFACTGYDSNEIHFFTKA